MFVEEMRAAIAVARRHELPAVTQALWKAYGAGAVTDAEAEALSGLIEARTALPPATPAGSVPQVAQAARVARAGSRPRTPDSIARRRRWAASGLLPNPIAAQFTPGEQAALAVVASETLRRGDCRFALEHVAAIAGVCRSTVRNALRQARRLGLVTVEERPLTAWRNDTNIVRIVDRAWLGWLALRSQAKGGGVKSLPGTSTISQNRSRRAQRNPDSSAGRQGRVPVASRLNRRE